jgi:DNA-binding beta-propeller fold protein YncE
MNSPRSHARRARLAALLLFAPLALPAVASDGPAIPHDDVKNRWFHWETAPIAPFAISPDGLRLYTVNQPGARVVELDLATRATLREIPVGPGVVSIAFRPATSELWAVDSITSSLAVIDTGMNTIVRSIHVAAGPNGIAFTPNGDRAFVACSTASMVDVVRTSDYSVVQSIAIPAREPRGIVCTGDAVRVVAFRSGNGTAPRGNPATGWTDDVVEVRHVQEIAGAVPLPDRDLFHIVVGAVPGADVLDPSRTVRALGTTLYNLHARPGSNELWIPNTDALNADFVGDRNFPAGQVVRNRVAIVGATSTSFVDLDSLTVSADRRCATPTSVAFTSDGSRAFVTGYGSDTVAVLNLSGASPQLDGLLRVTPARNYPDGAGPRVAVVTPGNGWLVISNKGDNTLTWFDLDDLPSAPGYDLVLPPAVDLGWDPTPSNLKQGRIHFIRTQNSLSGTSSCDSCHVDGHTDGLAWDLSSFLDPEGTPRGQLHLPLDRKGPLVTQSVRGMREVGPYHWRGERKRLVDFNAVFIDLLERHEDGKLDDLGGKMVYVGQYMDFLAPRANPGQAADRNYTSEELAGANLFLNKPVLGSLRCVDCHPLPLGTSGEMTINHFGGFSPDTKVPALRNVADKLTPAFQVGVSFGDRTELGAGLDHAGNSSSLPDLLLAKLPPPASGKMFQLDWTEAAALSKFLRGLDSGIAPAAVWQATANVQNSGSFLAGELAPLLAQAQAGNCEVVYVYGPKTWNGAAVYFTGLYDPVSDRFHQASQTLADVSTGELLNLATNGTPVTFLGVPLLAGQPTGLDRDNDGLFDLDERLAGTDWEREDSDDDGFPDGYEVHWGMNPLVQDQTSPDTVAPGVIGQVRVVWTTARSAKIEFATNEQVRALFSYDGGYPILRWPLLPSFDDRFSVVLNELEPGRETSVGIHLTDPAGNASDVNVPVRTLDRVLPVPVRVEDIELDILHLQSADKVRARIHLRRGDVAPALGYNVRAALYHDSPTHGPSLVKNLQTWLARSDGVVVFLVPVPATIHPGDGKFVLAIQGIDAPTGQPLHVRGEDVEQRASLDY